MLAGMSFLQGGPVSSARTLAHTRLELHHAARRLTRHFQATVSLMQVLARACGHDHLSGFGPDDLTTWSRDIAALTGVKYAGVGPLD